MQFCYKDNVISWVLIQLLIDLQWHCLCQVLKAVTAGLFLNAAQFDHAEYDPKRTNDSGSNVYRLLRHMQPGETVMLCLKRPIAGLHCMYQCMWLAADSCWLPGVPFLLVKQLLQCFHTYPSVLRTTCLSSIACHSFDKLTCLLLCGKMGGLHALVVITPFAAIGSMNYWGVNAATHGHQLSTMHPRTSFCM